MSRFASCLGVFLMTAGMAAGCTQAPVTGRNQLILIDGGQANQLGAEAWQQINRSEEHTSELQSLMRISYAVFCLKKKKHNHTRYAHNNISFQTTKQCTATSTTQRT